MQARAALCTPSERAGKAVEAVKPSLRRQYLNKAAIDDAGGRVL